MRPGIRFLSLVLWVAAASPLRAQGHDSTDAQRREASLVLDHTFTSTIGEPVRVFLAKGATYHAEIQGTGIQLRLKTLLASTQAPLIEPLLSGTSAGGASIYIVKPRADAMYVFTTLGGDATSPVTLHLYAVKGPVDKKP